MTVEQIKELMAEMARCGLTGLEWSGDGQDLKLTREQTMVSADALAQIQLPLAAAPTAEAGATATEDGQKEDEAPAGTVVKSPVVGVFYLTPSPDADPFISVGDAVKKGDVLCIVEAMKLMNEVLSEVGGTVRKILVSNGEKVEYGQPLLVIE